MALKLMYITNRPEIAQIAESAGVDRIFVDMEYIGKQERQGGMDTVQSHHTIEDIHLIRQAIRQSELLVRCNPVHNASNEYDSTEEEIEKIIAAGADLIMLPFFKTADEVDRFLCAVDGRAKTILLLETPEAVGNIGEILSRDMDEIHVGLNDLSLGYHKKFMFELLSDGTVEKLCFKFRQRGIPYGFGGIASLGKGDLPSEMIIKEHYRLGSTRAILSRSFCDANRIDHYGVISSTFVNGVQQIRALEQECALHRGYFEDNRQEMTKRVSKIVMSAK